MLPYFDSELLSSIEELQGRAHHNWTQLQIMGRGFLPGEYELSNGYQAVAEQLSRAAETLKASKAACDVAASESASKSSS